MDDCERSARHFVKLANGRNRYFCIDDASLMAYSGSIVYRYSGPRWIDTTETLDAYYENRGRVILMQRRANDWA